MAIAFDATGGNTIAPGSSPITWSHNCTGSNLVLLVGVEVFSGSATGVTYNGVAMTQLAASASYGSGVKNYIYGLVAPATGANTVSASFSGGSTFVKGISASYTGVSQTGLPDAAVTDGSSAGTTTFTKAITTVSNNAWATIFAYNDTPITASTGVTKRAGQSSDFAIWGDSNGPITPAGSYSMTITYSSSSTTVVALVSIAPATGTTNGNFLAFM